MPRKNGSGFQAEVLTHLSYIREKHDKQDKKFEKVFDKLDNEKDRVNERFGQVDKRIDVIDKDISKAKGYAVGAMAAGGIGGVAGVWASIKSFFGG